ncbi:nucleosome assembly protein 1;3-like [Fagus crenata]
MVSLIISISASLTLTPARAFFRPPHVPNPPAIRFPGFQTHRRTRGSTVVTRAGPSANSYLFAFALPLSLLAITVFASIGVADKLERDYLEELAINQAIKEAEEEDEEEEGDEEEDVNISLEKEPALQRTRNRPKREV